MDEAATQRRLELIRQIEAARNSRLITYILSDRRGAQAQIAEDAVRAIYDHLRAIGRCEPVDLFLYSVGGHTEVPWRIVSTIREVAAEFYGTLAAAGDSGRNCLTPQRDRRPRLRPRDRGVFRPPKTPSGLGVGMPTSTAMSLRILSTQMIRLALLLARRMRIASGI